MSRAHYSYLMLTAVAFLLSMVSCGAVDGSPSKRIVGGQCEYREYTGKATVVSVRPRELQDRDPRPDYDQYEVRFIFHPDETIQERHGQVEGREFHLLQRNSRYPGPAFLRKYGIEEGSVLDGSVKVITRGTCTPILFDFPLFDLDDHSEGEE